MKIRGAVNTAAPYLWHREFPSMLNPLSAAIFSSILPPKASVYSLTALSRSGDELYFLSFVSALSAEKPACCLGGAAVDKWEVFLDKCCA